jgi:uncharacterized Zn-finger protein
LLSFYDLSISELYFERMSTDRRSKDAAETSGERGDDVDENDGASPSSSSNKQEHQHPRVFLRLRPMNKLEEARRSKDCVELDDDPRKVLIDAPIQGMHEFKCDMVSVFFLSTLLRFIYYLLLFDKKYLTPYHICHSNFYFKMFLF